jgi:hypothetical protein
MNTPLEAAIAANRERSKFTGGFDAPEKAAAVSSQVEAVAPSAEEVAGTRIELVTPDAIIVESAKIDGLSEQVLRGFARSMRLDIRLQDVKIVGSDGRTTDGKRPFVFSKDAAGKETALSLLDFFKATGEETILDILQAKPEPEPEKRGLRFPAQGSPGANNRNEADDVSRAAQGVVTRKYAHNRPAQQPTQRDEINARNRGAR